MAPWLRRRIEEVLKRFLSGNEFNWSEVNRTEMNLTEVEWTEQNLGEVNRTEMNFSAANGMELSWSEILCTEVKRTERNRVLLWAETKTYILKCVIRLHLQAVNNISWIETTFRAVWIHCLQCFCMYVLKRIKLPPFT